MVNRSRCRTLQGGLAALLAPGDVQRQLQVFEEVIAWASE